MLEEQISLLTQQSKAGDSKTTADFSTWLYDTFGIDMPSTHIGDLMRQGTLRQEIMSLLEEDLGRKLETAGAENLNLFIRFSYLEEIDEKWLDHLESMEALREAVYLRSYAQKNPLLEYKLEGSDIFESLIMSIRHNIASKVFRVRIRQESESAAASTAPARTDRSARAETSHAEFGAFAGAVTSAPESSVAAAAAPANVTVVRAGQKIGRNDPCPCGSGKKYKHCHGR